MPVLAMGVSYRRAPVELLERLAFGDDDFPKAYQRLAQLDSVAEAVVLSTCNRIEVYAEVEGYHQGFQDLKRFLAESRDVATEEFAEPLYSHYEDHAAEHLFSVAAGIDSMVLGEPQILAQVRVAIRRAEAEGAAGAVLTELFRHAVRAGRRARAETAIGASPAAFVEAGARLAAEHLGGLQGRSAVVVGSGEMGALAVRTLRVRVGQVRVLGRNAARAERLATRAGVAHGTLDALEAALAAADLVFSSTASTSVLIPEDLVERARRGTDRRLFILDLAVPRDVDPAAGRLPGVRLYDIDDLRPVVEGNGATTRRAVDEVRGIVSDETRRYTARRRAARLAPIIEALHARGEAVRAAELRQAAKRLSGLSQRERQAVQALTRGIVRKLLHDPVVRLKERAVATDDPLAQALAELFDLGEPED
jgi:glutamyl-tRNA reductase